MKLSTKLASLVFVSMVLVIVAMVTSFYVVSKNFYKEQLQIDVEHRLHAHREVIEAHMSSETFEHVIKMEQRRKENAFVIWDKDFRTRYEANLKSQEMLALYQEWLLAEPMLEGRTEYVETIAHHIPHIWSYQPVIRDGQVVGYLFIDQDTGNFEQARSKLLAISMVMGMITLLFSGFLTIFFSKKITLPLIKASKLTKRIAQGDFDIKLTSNGKDEIANLNKHISSMAGQLKEYRDSRQQFLTNISHDLRTPLTYIKAYAAILKEGEFSPNQGEEQARIIYQEAVRMEGLVNDLFQLMKLEEGSIQIMICEVELVDFMRDVTNKVKLTAEEKGVKIVLSTSDPIITVKIDSEQFERAILNLLQNGIRHTPPQGSITIRLRETDNKVTIEIADTGEGIPNEDLPHIWDRFYRVDKSRSTKQGGSGLGLAITKQIIDLHGAMIHVESGRNKGTRFVVTFLK